MSDIVIVVNAKNARWFIRWALWATVSLVTLTFAMLCFAIGGKLVHLSNSYYIHAAEVRHVTIASFFTAAVVLLFIAVSFFLTLRLPVTKPYSRYLNTTLVVSLVYMFLITLLSVLVMHGSYKELEDNYKYSHLYTATVVFGYMSVVLYLFYAVASFYIIFWFKKKPKEKDIEEVPLQTVT